MGQIVKGLRSSKATVEAKTNIHTSAYTVLAKESGAHFSNEGAATSVTFTLPTAVVGREYTFTNGRTSGDILVLSPNGSDTINIGPAAATTTIRTSALGNSITLKCYVSGKWSAKDVVGIWTQP